MISTLYIPVNVEMTPVESSNIAAVGFDPSYGIFVQFKNNETYRYPNEDYATYQALLAAESKGQFFNQTIKPKPVFQKLPKLMPTK